MKQSNVAALPNNFLAEEAILNLLLTNPSLVKDAVLELKAESFHFLPHKLIYEVLVKSSENNEIINLTSVITSLQDQNKLAEIGGIQRIVNIINRFENLSDLDNYIKQVNEKYLRRLIIEIGKQIIIWGYTTSEDLETILDKMEQSIFSLSQERLSQKIYSAAEIMDDVFTEMKAKMKGGTLDAGFASSFKDLDSIIQGFQKSDLIVIAGRPSMGKTAFSLNLGTNIVEKYNVPLLIFTLEMSRQQIIYRLISTASDISASRLRSGRMTPTEWKNLGNTMKEISDLPIYIDDNPNITLIDIRSKLKKVFTGNAKKGVVIIDYLQLMKLGAKLENRVAEISYITRNLKILAKEFDIPIIVLSQLSRNVESRTNKRPMLSDLRESGSIEQDADIVIMLYREEYYKETRADAQVIELIVAKHRNGPIGTAKLMFIPSLTSFSNL
jgi:replicative DNA helicase